MFGWLFVCLSRVSGIIVSPDIPSARIPSDHRVSTDDGHNQDATPSASVDFVGPVVLTPQSPHMPAPTINSALAASPKHTLPVRTAHYPAPTCSLAASPSSVFTDCFGKAADCEAAGVQHGSGRGGARSRTEDDGEAARADTGAGEFGESAEHRLVLNRRILHSFPFVLL